MQRRSLTAALLVLALTPPSAQAAGTGGVAPTQPTGPSGGLGPGTRVKPKPKPKPKPSYPLLRSFSLGPSVIYTLGARGVVKFRIDRGGKTLPVKLVLRPAGGGKASIVDLGTQPTGREVTTRWSATGLPSGSYTARVFARDRKGQALRRGAKVASTASVSVRRHRFPVAGPHSMGGDGARFGAPRTGHIHQGQDIIAAEGTPLVAPHAGTVTWIRYQASGAGHYLVIKSADENRSYVLMHCVEGSIIVEEGQRVRTGQRVAAVGTTGASSGPHLHFEIWEGAWYDGGHAIDPLPDLLQWDRWS